MGHKKASLQSMGWAGFWHVYLYYCWKEVKHSLEWSLVALAVISTISAFSNSTILDLLGYLTDIGLRVAPPLLGFTLSGYALIVGVNDVTISILLKTHKTKSGIPMYQKLYTTFIAMLFSIFLVLLESVLLNYALKANIEVNFSSWLIITINVFVFSFYTFTLFYAIFAVKDLLSNLFSLGQTANIIYQSMENEKKKKAEKDSKAAQQ